MKPKIREKVWDPKLEKGIWKRWEKNKLFQFKIKTKKKIFSIDTPPPYPKSL